MFKSNDKPQMPLLNVPAVTLPLDIALATIFRSHQEISDRTSGLSTLVIGLSEQLSELRNALIDHLKEHNKQEMSAIMQKRLEAEEVPDLDKPKKSDLPN